MSGHGFIDPRDLGLTPDKLRALFSEDEDELDAESELYERHMQQEAQRTAWVGVAGDLAWCDAAGDGRHIGAPCLGCTATPPGWIA